MQAILEKKDVRSITMKDFIKIFERDPFGEKVVEVMKKIGYHKKKISASDLTMDLCFAGMLSNVDITKMRKVQKKHLKRAT